MINPLGIIGSIFHGAAHGSLSPAKAPNDHLGIFVPVPTCGHGLVLEVKKPADMRGRDMPLSQGVYTVSSLRDMVSGRTSSPQQQAMAACALHRLWHWRTTGAVPRVEVVTTQKVEKLMLHMQFAAALPQRSYASRPERAIAVRAPRLQPAVA